MPERSVLYVCHNHPSARPGGAEAYAVELFEAMRRSRSFRPLLLAKGGPPMSRIPWMREGTRLSAIDGRPDEYFLHTEMAEFDSLLGVARNKEIPGRHFRRFLEEFRPDVFHFQHTHFLGYDLIREVRATLPDAPIVYTLHEYLPICHRQGQMVRATDDGLCDEASPRRCHECFPDVSPELFFLRKRFIQSHFELVDAFLAPSRFLLERYVAWGIPRRRIRFEDYGRLPAAAVSERADGRPRNRIGFFGQFTSFKGVDVLLRAARILAERDVDVRFWIHGDNLELQPAAFRDEIEELLSSTRGVVTNVGRYRPAELGRLMSNVDWVVVPSIWWENSPLVIQEAFQHRRPVIASDVGGMAEKVADGVNGLHFRVRDPVSLAETIERAATTPGLWRTLRDGIPDVYSMKRHVAALTGLYRSLLRRRSGAGPRTPDSAAPSPVDADPVEEVIRV